MLSVFTYAKKNGYDGIEMTVDDFRAKWMPDAPYEQVVASIQRCVRESGVAVVGALFHVTDGECGKGLPWGPNQRLHKDGSRWDLDFDDTDFWTEMGPPLALAVPLRTPGSADVDATLYALPPHVHHPPRDRPLSRPPPRPRKGGGLWLRHLSDLAAGTPHEHGRRVARGLWCMRPRRADPARLLEAACGANAHVAVQPTHAPPSVATRRRAHPTAQDKAYIKRVAGDVARLQQLCFERGLNFYGSRSLALALALALA